MKIINNETRVKFTYLKHNIGLQKQIEEILKESLHSFDLETIKFYKDELEILGEKIKNGITNLNRLGFEIEIEDLRNKKKMLLIQNMLF